MDSINSWSPEYIDSLFQSWQQDPTSVDPQWQTFFSGFQLGLTRDASALTAATATSGGGLDPRQVQVNALADHYRRYGHLLAQLDPLGRPRPAVSGFRLEDFGLTDADLGATFRAPVAGWRSSATLADILAHLKATYCGRVASEFAHIEDARERAWLQERIESLALLQPLPTEEKLRTHKKLLEAEYLEAFLHKNFPGEKRFSLEGGESLIPMLDLALSEAAEHGVAEAVIGMAHRGRLNVLVNIANKGAEDLFAEFIGNYVPTYHAGGDVKYHKGYSTNFQTVHGKQVYLTLATNPSHLEAVNAVVLGRARAGQRLRKDSEKRRVVLPILVHGDAAVAGQGVVMETFQMMQLPAYRVGGTLHLVVNNQVGFTTDPECARSTTYCTDIGKMFSIPVFHVNGDDPELCAQVVRLCIEYRLEFGKDALVDLWCFRKYGHNEGDEPTYTQPVMYDLIKNKKSVLTLYAERLTSEGVLSPEDVERANAEMLKKLTEAREASTRRQVLPNPEGFREKWVGYDKRWSYDPVPTAVSQEKLTAFAERMFQFPEGYVISPKQKRILQARRDGVIKNEGIDWGGAESLAFASLLAEGIPVRLTGQDVRRGTFTHRHAVVLDARSEEPFVPLNNVAEGQAKFCIYDSLLAEYAAVGYEYGYSITDPQMLIIWEAQFGDFANTAQVMIDQFLASAEVKWDRSSGLVMLLPHGYEGQGPEHSSARLERFLQLCAEENIQVVNSTLPAQYFHLLRRQMLRRFRKPLVVMSPKKNLRFEREKVGVVPQPVSYLADLTAGTFQEVLDDPQITDAKAVRKVLLCSGKVFFDLAEERARQGRKDIAIVRIEQLYPLHAPALRAVLDRYSNATDYLWVQEEPRNMGAWSYIHEAVEEKVGIRMGYIGRPASATPAAGSAKIHAKEVRAYLEAAFPAQAAVAKV